MSLTPSKINTFLMFKLPSAYLCGVRVKTLETQKCVTTVRHRWINQNPFKSLFWAVQGMAAELSTGAIIINKIKESKKNIAMLLVKNEASYSKKATGRIYFKCSEGNMVNDVIDKAINTGEGQMVTLNVVGSNSNNEEVSRFSFTWSMKVRT
ncbi:MAG: thioesterase [Bacteroidetes bacterium]|nr:MAG: thioesterase [Bacteroidota bacterium]